MLERKQKKGKKMRRGRKGEGVERKRRDEEGRADGVEN